MNPDPSIDVLSAVDGIAGDLASDEVMRAILSRRSVRGFRPTPVPIETVRRLLEAARRAPSGSNIQPWSVHVVTGAALARLTKALSETFDAGAPERREYNYYPVTWRSPYLERRRAVGWSLYALAGIGKGDRAGGDRQRARNFSFFGAPCAFVFTIDRDLEIGSWLDYGMFLQSLMIAARGFGLDTCAQAAIASYPDIVRRELAIADDKLVICAMALSFADPDEPTNALTTEREPVDGFTRFHTA